MTDGDMEGRLGMCTVSGGIVDVGQLVRLTVRMSWVDGVTLSEWLPRRWTMVESRVNDCLRFAGCGVRVHVYPEGANDVGFSALAQRGVVE